MSSADAPAGQAIGVIECRGVVATMAALEAMCTSAAVECVLLERVSSGVLVVAVRGDLASVRQAVEIGEAAARRYGQLRNTQVYPRLTPGIAPLFAGPALGARRVELAEPKQEDGV